jgi:hypothetical protein
MAKLLHHRRACFRAPKRLANFISGSAGRRETSTRNSRNTEEAEIVKEMREYFTQAKQKSGVINFDRLGLWSNIQKRIDLWIREACSWKHLNPNQVPRAREAILHRLKDLLAKTIRETLGVVSP